MWHQKGASVSRIEVEEEKGWGGVGWWEVGWGFVGNRCKICHQAEFNKKKKNLQCLGMRD